MDRKQYCGSYSVIENDGTCVYCGQRANSLDHFVPYSVAIVLMEFLPIGGKYLLPACRECNSIAGDKVFYTVNEKRSYIQGRLKEKYSLIYDIPEWTESELEEMGYNLQTYIRSSLGSRQWIEDRIKWRNKDNPSYVKIATIRSHNLGHGRSFAQSNVGNIITTTSVKTPLMIIESDEMEVSGSRKKAKLRYPKHTKPSLLE